MCWSQRGLSSSNWAGSPRNPRRNPQQCRCQPWCVGCSKDPTKVIHKNKSTVHFRKQGIKDSKQQGSHPAPIQLSTGYAISTHFVDPPLLVNLCDLVLPTGSENLDSPVGLGYICFQKQESRVFVGPVPHTPFWHPTPASWVEGTDSSRRIAYLLGACAGCNGVHPSIEWPGQRKWMWPSVPIVPVYTDQTSPGYDPPWDTMPWTPWWPTNWNNELLMERSCTPMGPWDVPRRKQLAENNFVSSTSGTSGEGWAGYHHLPLPAPMW